MKKLLANCKRLTAEARDFFEEKSIRTMNREQLSRLHKFAHFWLLVGKSFVRNRCPIRASALAYTTLLALIPLLFVAASVSSSILKKQGREGVHELINRLVANVTPVAPADTNIVATNSTASSNFANTNTVSTNASSVTGTNSPTVGNQQLIVDKITESIDKIRPGALGTTCVALLIFIAISMIARIESTFNDIWGVARGRSLVSQIIHYWTAISLGTVLLVVAVGQASSPHVGAVRELLGAMPLVGGFVVQYLPVLVLCLFFTLFYIVMPNTKVHFRAALAGGVMAGVLWHLNNHFSVLYVSRWVTNSAIYGSLAVIPVFMVGLYFSWLILLFGAQVSYAWQNRAVYMQEKLTENINQRGREFIALRLMQCIGQRFLRGQRPATVPEMADALIVPTRLVQQIMHTLMAAGIVVEVAVEAAGRETGYSPARPLEAINGHDILLALRAGQGQELATREDPARLEIYGEYEKILEAERKAASTVTVLTMASRAEALGNHDRKAIAESKK